MKHFKSNLVCSFESSTPGIISFLLVAIYGCSVGTLYTCIVESKNRLLSDNFALFQALELIKTAKVEALVSRFVSKASI